jgi:ferrous iron transport protein A
LTCQPVRKQSSAARLSRQAAKLAERELALRLFEIGFIDGELVRVVARGCPGGDPVAVRVGNTMFALRRFEAERVLVSPLRGAVA